MTYRDVQDNLRRTLERHFMLFLLVVVRLSCILFYKWWLCLIAPFYLIEIPECFLRILYTCQCTCKYLGTCMKFFKNISKKQLWYTDFNEERKINIYNLKTTISGFICILVMESINQSRILHSMDEFFSLVFHWLEIHLCSSVVRVP